MSISKSPLADFPLTKHPNGQFYNWHEGKRRFFGSVKKPEAALAKYEACMANTLKVAKPSPAAKKPAVAPPYKSFPLYAHRTGRWAGTIRHVDLLLRPVADWKGGLERYNEQKDDLYAGRTPSTETGLTVVEAADKFPCHRRVDSGEMVERTWKEYKQVCEQIVEHSLVAARLRRSAPKTLKACGRSLPHGMGWFG